MKLTEALGEDSTTKDVWQEGELTLLEYVSIVRDGNGRSEQLSYELYRGEKRIARFLYIDNGASTRQVADAFAEGMAAAIRYLTMGNEVQLHRPLEKREGSVWQYMDLGLDLVQRANNYELYYGKERIYNCSYLVNREHTEHIAFAYARGTSLGLRS